MDTRQGNRQNDDLLVSWKDIAAYLKCSVRKAQRLEGQELPVNRITGTKSVWASKSQIDRWLASQAERAKCHQTQFATSNIAKLADADIACCQKPGSGNGHQYTILFGPHFAYRGNARVHPFAHVLVGLAHGRQAAPYFHTTWRPGFAAGFGGGLDVKATRFLWVRAIQADYLRESFRDDVQKNGRLSFGIVFRFGKPVSR